MKSVVSIVLALCTLVSNVGLSMNTHFCGGMTVKTSFSVGLHDLDCGMAAMDNKCGSDHSGKIQIQQKPCCENQHQVFKMDDNVDVKPITTVAHPVFFTAFIHTFVQPLFFEGEAVAHTSYHPPPVPDKDFQVLFQVFLI